MTIRRARLFLPLAIAIPFAAGSVAHSEDALPVPTLLPCVQTCAVSVKAEPIAHPSAHFPAAELGNYGPFVEGFVDLRYTIGTDGRVRDVAVSRRIGPKDFADNAMDAVRSWTFKPAQADGKPVEQVSTVRFDFRVSGIGNGARFKIVKIVSQALAAVREDRLDDAQASLDQARDRAGLNYDELTMIAYAAAVLAYQRKDYLLARDEIGTATINAARNLDPGLLQPAIQMRIDIDLANGEMADALAWFGYLKKIAKVDENNPAGKRLAEARGRYDAATLIPISGRIPKQDDGDAWEHVLYRRTFGFANVVGKLESFQLSCDQQAIQSPITTTAEWHVPKNWSRCSVYVRGTSGTTFSLVEEN
jgi:TonB family protein